jgi:hypothetical protein
MIPQPAAPNRLTTSTAARPRSFWLTALLGLPVLNMAALIATASSAGDVLVPMAVGLALIELALLVALSPRYRIGVLGAVAALMGSAAITVLGLFAMVLAVFAACDGCLS